MKTTFYSTLICLIICLSSCDFNGSESSSFGQPEEQVQNGDISHLRREIESLRTQIATIDTTAGKTITLQVDSLHHSISMLNDKIDVFDDTQKKIVERIDNLENSKSERFFWILLCLCVISWIISVWSFIRSQKVSKIHNRLNRHREDLNRIEQDCNRLLSMNQTVLSNKNSITRLDTELNNLKFKLRSLNVHSELSAGNRKNTTNNPDFNKNRVVSGNPDKKTDTPIKNGYFGDIIGGTYFRELITCRNEQAVFSVSVKGDMAEFEPISLNMLKGNDNVRDGIETMGSRLQDATSMAVEEPGKAEKVADKWIIKSKAKIKLS